MANESRPEANSVKTRPFYTVNPWPYQQTEEELRQIELTEKLCEKLDADRAPLVHIYRGILKTLRFTEIELRPMRSRKYRIEAHISFMKDKINQLQEVLNKLTTPHLPARPGYCLHGNHKDMATERKKLRGIVRGQYLPEEYDEFVAGSSLINGMMENMVWWFEYKKKAGPGNYNQYKQIVEQINLIEERNETADIQKKPLQYSRVKGVLQQKIPKLNELLELLEKECTGLRAEIVKAEIKFKALDDEILVLRRRSDRIKKKKAEAQKSVAKLKARHYKMEICN